MLKRIVKIIKTTYFLNHFPKFITVLFTNKKKLLYYGFLGDGNFGDELVFKATKTLFKDCELIPYKRHMPILTKIYCRFFTGSIDGVVIGGGTLIRKFNSDKLYFKSLVAKGKPVFLHGTGADERIMDKKFWPSFLNNDFNGGVRGPQSQLALQNTGFDFRQLGDAALYLHEDLSKIDKKKLIVVNFGTHNVMEELNHSRGEIIKFLNIKSVEGYRLVYLPLHRIDYDLGKALHSEIPNMELLDIAHSYKSTLDLMSMAEFCLGERLHFVVMSVLANTDFLSINYDPKHDDFLTSLDLDGFGFSPKNIQLLQIEEIFNKKEGAIDWDKINTKIKELKSVHNSEKNSFIAKMDS
jgi:polysaccharide pyruvyl transferase WcaK-like protein